MAIVNYYKPNWGEVDSGGQIFDSKLIQSMRAGNDVRLQETRLFRKWTLPIWDKRLERMPSISPEGFNIVSHEGLHALVGKLRIDCFIVHNYFSELRIHRLSALEPMYRIGSSKIFERIFSASDRVVFLSAREHRLATHNYPAWSAKFFYCPPGYDASAEFFAGERDGGVIELPGTVDWIIKKASYKFNLGRGLPREGTVVHGQSDRAYISVVYDSFLSGFKLKLVEMARHGKSIISFSDLDEELHGLGFPELPYRYVRNREELGSAIDWFRKKGDVSKDMRKKFFDRGAAITWARVAATVLGSAERLPAQRPGGRASYSP